MASDDAPRYELSKGEPFDVGANDDIAIALVFTPSGAVEDLAITAPVDARCDGHVSHVDDDGWFTVVAGIDRTSGRSYIEHLDGRVEDVTDALQRLDKRLR